jgi:outer membrane immunogenic protein
MRGISRGGCDTGTCHVGTWTGLMSKALFAVAMGACVVVTAPALAADVGGPFPGYMPVAAPVFTWTGFYAGLNLGGGTATATSTDPTFGGSSSSSATGVIGGGQIGGNVQEGSFVWGLELDGQGSWQSKTTNANLFGVALSETDSIPWFATVRGRLGYALMPGWLVYATAGGAWIDAKATVTASVPGFSASTGWETSHAGWVAGVGLESAINPNWSWKIEYIYIDTGTFSTSVNPFGLGNVPLNVRIQDSIGRIGVNYRF